MKMLKLNLNWKLFFIILYPSRFPGYIGYKKSGINIASFDQWGSFWDVTCNLDFTCIPLRQNMTTMLATSSWCRWILWIWDYSSFQLYPEEPSQYKNKKR